MENSVPAGNTRFGLTGNALKIIAAISMLIDHIGYLLLPQFPILRVIGRLAYTIFAFMIAEGCRYTRNKLRYFLGIFLLAVLCQTVYFVVEHDTDLSILVTFSLSILLIYAWQACRKAFSDSNILNKVIAFTLFVTVIAAVYVLNSLFEIDYGFWGSMVPLFATMFMGTKGRMDTIPVHVTMLCIGLVILSLDLGDIQYFCLLALPLLYLYTGKRGMGNLKYFFYIFYPVHLVVLQGISLLLR